MPFKFFMDQILNTMFDPVADTDPYRLVVFIIYKPYHINDLWYLMDYYFKVNLDILLLLLRLYIRKEFEQETTENKT